MSQNAIEWTSDDEAQQEDHVQPTTPLGSPPGSANEAGKSRVRLSNRKRNEQNTRLRLRTKKREADDMLIIAKRDATWLVEDAQRTAKRKRLDSDAKIHLKMLRCDRYALEVRSTIMKEQQIHDKNTMAQKIETEQSKAIFDSMKWEAVRKQKKLDEDLANVMGKEKLLDVKLASLKQDQDDLRKKTQECADEKDKLVAAQAQNTKNKDTFIQTVAQTTVEMKTWVNHLNTRQTKQAEVAKALRAQQAINEEKKLKYADIDLKVMDSLIRPSTRLEHMSQEWIAELDKNTNVTIQSQTYTIQNRYIKQLMIEIWGKMTALERIRQNEINKGEAADY